MMCLDVQQTEWTDKKLYMIWVYTVCLGPSVQILSINIEVSIKYYSHKYDSWVREDSF